MTLFMVVVSESNIARLAGTLGRSDVHMGSVIEKYGVPPLWSRKPGFATLLQIILEQQVSLASARACFEKISSRVGPVTPEALLLSGEADLRRDGFSRQKASYAKHLAASIVEGRIDLEAVSLMSDADAKAELMKLKGIGSWSSDIYLLMALGRPDVMPKGDLALHIAWQNLSGGPRPRTDEFLHIAERWRPFRSVAARLLWHFYLSEKGKS